MLRRVDQIIREEMNRIGGQEILMAALHPKRLWEQTGRWESFDALLKVISHYKRWYALGPTHEEVVFPLIKEFVFSYRDLPVFVYQIQTKFRDEPRAKSGVLRGREFGMKDMYSFHASMKDLEDFYEKVKVAYLKIFKRCGLDAKITEASGGDFTKRYSHEFMVLTPAGEDTIVYCSDCTFCQNLEISKLKAGDNCPRCGKGLKEAKAIEVGNIFNLETKFSKDFGVYFMDKRGKRRLVVAGCYGIGDSRLVGTIVEVHHDERGIIWPESVAPYQVHLVTLGGGDKRGEEVYKKLREKGVEVLWDDREESAGVKFADADLIGIPVRLVVSKKTGKQIEWKRRGEEKTEVVGLDEVFKRLE